MKQMTVVFGGGLLLIALTAGAASRIDVSVSPRYGFAPTNLVIAVVTERHADNRILRVVAILYLNALDDVISSAVADISR